MEQQQHTLQQKMANVVWGRYMQHKNKDILSLLERNSADTGQKFYFLDGRLWTPMLNVCVKTQEYFGLKTIKSVGAVAQYLQPHQTSE